MLAREKAVLGFFVTRHPLTSCSDLVESCSTAATVDLSSYEDGGSVILGGLITDIRYILLRNGRKQGQRMAIVTLEDLKGKVEVTISPKELDEYRHLLKPDAIIFVKGSVNRKREEPSVRVGEVIAAERAPSVLCDSVIVRVDEMRDSSEVVERLFDVISRHRGACPLYVEIQTDEHEIATIKCSDDMSVKASPECLHELASLIGETRVICTGPNRKPIPWPSIMTKPTSCPQEAPVSAEPQARIVPPTREASMLQQEFA